MATASILTNFLPMLDDPELQLLDEATDRFFGSLLSIETLNRWTEQGIVDRDAWQRAGEAGFLCAAIPVEYGGAGGDFRHEAVILRQLYLHGGDGWQIPMHSGIVSHYIFHYGSEEQKRRWLPQLAAGTMIGALAMTEPGTGSDLQTIKTRAIREGDHYRINGSKIFITNGQLADLIVLVTSTDPSARGRGLSLIVVETKDLAGFKRGRNLEKIGLEMSDTSELFFEDMLVPVGNLLGAEGDGFIQLKQQLPQERLLVAWECTALMERALAVTIPYTHDRTAFGKPVFDFQNTQFKLAEAQTKTAFAKVFCDYCTTKLIKGELDSATASMAKLSTSETAQSVIDSCLQLHGGYGYMNEYPIARLFKDIRVKQIYGGTSEIMKILIARSL